MSTKPHWTETATIDTTQIAARAKVQEYEDAFRVISKLRADGVITATVYALLWEGLEDKRAVDRQYSEALKNILPVTIKSSS